jgi:hypothetical protein
MVAISVSWRNVAATDPGSTTPVRSKQRKAPAWAVIFILALVILVGLRRRLASNSTMTNTFVPPKWDKPGPLSYGEAIDTVTTIAAPLLAGFSIATIGVVGASSDKFRWPGIALIFLTGAALLLVGSVQCGFHARAHRYSPANIKDWWPADELTPIRLERLQREQWINMRLWRRWIGRAKIAYDIGIVALALGVAAVLAPPGHERNPVTLLVQGDQSRQSGWRWAAAAIAVAGAVGEIVWIAINKRKSRKRGT